MVKLFSRLQASLKKTREGVFGKLNRIFMAKRKIDDELLEEIEDIIFKNPQNPLTNWSKDDLIKSIEELGFENITTKTLI